MILDNSKIDEEVFTKYIRKAAENNNISAQYNLGYLLFNGKMVFIISIIIKKKLEYYMSLTDILKTLYFNFSQ